MKVLVCGASGAVGRAVVQALRSRGHRVVAASRSGAWRINFMEPVAPAAWGERLQTEQIEAVVNCVGILMPGPDAEFERVHNAGPVELFEGAALAGISRVVQVSALGAEAGGSAYLSSKAKADDALLALPLHACVLRPSLLVGPGCASTRLFATLAAMPVVALPGGGEQPLRPLHVYELAEIVVRCLERKKPLSALSGVFELGGGQTVSYREMLAQYRTAVGAGAALWLPMPMALMQASAWLAEALPQQVFCRETIAMLARGNVPTHNAAGELLGRAPSGLAEALRVTPPEPWIDLRVALSPAAAGLLRAALVLMWLWVAAVSAAMPQTSGVWLLLERCGFEGHAMIGMWLASCALNAGLGLALWWRPTAMVHALQCAAITGYTAVAAWYVPLLTLDHCGGLIKNTVLLAAVLILWLATPIQEKSAAPHAAVRPSV